MLSMARRARMHYPGAVHHVMLRGNGSHREEFHSGASGGRILGDEHFAEDALRKAGESEARSMIA